MNHSKSIQSSPLLGSPTWGKFGSLFASLDAQFELPLDKSVVEQLIGLAAQSESDGAAIAEERRERGSAAAGQTYFGQLVAHDVSLDPRTLGEKGRGAAGVGSFRTPRLDLDCIYGRGPLLDPHLYAFATSSIGEFGALVEHSFPVGRAQQHVSGRNPFEFDLPRRTRGVAPLNSFGEVFVEDTAQRTLAELLGRDLVEGMKVASSVGVEGAVQPNAVLKAVGKLEQEQVDVVDRFFAEVHPDHQVSAPWGADHGRFALLAAGDRVWAKPRGGREHDWYRVVSSDQLRVGEACIADPRNDDNLLVAQVHLALTMFHNRVLTDLAAKGEASEPMELFHRAREIVVRHYQWLVVHDYLDSIVGPEIAAAARERGRQWCESMGGQSATGSSGDEGPGGGEGGGERGPFVPIEFTAAAFRALHAMPRDRYRLNERGHQTFALFDDREERDLRGGRVLPGHWSLQWDLFFGDRAQRAFPIGRTYSSALSDLPTADAGVAGLSLLARDLLRGAEAGLPTGAAVARALGIEPISDGEGLPFVLYALKEAEDKAQGHHLGPVAGRLVADTLVRLVALDPESYMHADGGHWSPLQHPYATAEGFTFLDIVRAAGLPVSAEEWATSLEQRLPTASPLPA